MFVPVKLRTLLKSYILSELADRNYMVGESCFRFESRIKERVSIVYHLFKKNVKKLLNKEAFILAFLKNICIFVIRAIICLARRKVSV